jgi:hypothetical protein
MRTAIAVTAALVLFLVLALVPAIAGEGDDEVESNNTKALADSIDGLTINGHMDEDDGDDWFVLEGQEGVQPVFTIIFDADEVEVDFEVYSDDEVVGSAVDWGSGETLECHVPGTCYIHVWWWEGEGDYTIRINPKSERCAGADEVEPNDEKDLADEVEELEIHGYICENDHDWFVLTGQEGYNPTFTIYFDDEDDLEIDFEIYSGDELVDGAYDWGSEDSVTCEVPGTCYVHVYYWSGEGEYTIEIEPEE